MTENERKIQQLAKEMDEAQRRVTRIAYYKAAYCLRKAARELIDTPPFNQLEQEIKTKFFQIAKEIENLPYE